MKKEVLLIMPKHKSPSAKSLLEFGSKDKGKAGKYKDILRYDSKPFQYDSDKIRKTLSM